MFWKQLYLLLWKNFTLRKRHWVQTVIEILWPLLLFVLLVAIRRALGTENVTECHYPARAMPSAGVYPWLKSFVCDVQNPCFSKEVPSEVPGQVNAPDARTTGTTTTGTALSDLLLLLRTNTTIQDNLPEFTSDLDLLTSVSTIVSPTPVSLSSLLVDSAAYNNFLTTNLSLTSSIANSLSGSSTTLEQALQLSSALGSRPTVCNETLLSASMTVLVSGSSNASVLSVALCSLTDTQLSILSAITSESLQSTADVLNAFLTTGLNSSQQTAFTRLAGYSAELQPLRSPLAILQQAGANSLLTSLLGFDSASPFAFQSFCGHPELKLTGASLLFTTGVNAIFNGTSSSLNVNNTVFCNNLVGMFENNPLYTDFWGAVKPLMNGKIPYFPNTPLVQSIIAHANTTFKTMELVISFGENWKTTFGSVFYDTFENGETAASVRNVLASPVSLSLLAAQLDLPFASLEQLKTFLSNVDNPSDTVTTWKDLYRQIDNALTIIAKVFGCFDLDKFQGFDLEASFTAHASGLVNNNTLWGGVSFLSPSTSDISLPKVVKYKIRQDAVASTDTTDVQRFFWLPRAEDDNTRVKYYDNGFVHIQDMIENAIIQTSLGSNASSDSIYNLVFGKYIQQMPYPCYTEDSLLQYLAPMMSLFMTLAWIYSVAMIVKSIVYEKEQRLKEVMKMMGLSNAVHWIAWFITSFAVIFTSALLLIIILKFGGIFPYSNVFILIIWLVSFASATITQCFLISCFFSRANLAAACGGIIFFLLHIPYNVLFAFTGRTSLAVKVVASLLSSVAFGYGTAYIADFELSGDGIQFFNWAKSPNPSDDYSFLLSMIMMIVDAFLYMTLAWYIENVFPGKYGVPKRWYFFVTRSYWCGNQASNDSDVADNGIADISSQIRLEAEPKHLTLGVAMQNLRKVYSNGKVAVDDLSLNFYEGQITSFLGHNGAGKTTTMSMLTGLFPPTSGSAHIYGNDIQTEMDEIRHRLGFCPQYNVLFGDLTVLEHLQFYSGLKNAAGGNKESSLEIEGMVKDVGLPHKKNEITQNLSGGMKRKLSVAIAFVGGSKCVILDEPTAGVDPYARRGIWDLLLRYRDNRTILLSTHHMDEADLLGDRIAIISHGKLKCCGSSLFLKGCFGVGYYLTVVKNTGDTKQSIQEEASDEGFDSNSSNSSKPSSSSITPVSERSPLIGINNAIVTADIVQSSQVTNLVLKTVPESKVHEENPREATFILPYAAQTNGRFAKLFEELDVCGVTYGLTDTSLEEIFLSVAEQSKDEGKEEKTSCCFCIPRLSGGSITPDDPSYTPDLNQTRTGRMTRHHHSNSVEMESSQLDLSQEVGKDDAVQGQGTYKVQGRSLVWQQFKALFIKRLHNFSRSLKGFIAQSILPVIFIGLSLGLQNIFPPDEALPPLEMQPWMYGDTNTFFSQDSAASTLSSDVKESLLAEPTLGMRCVNQYQVLNYDDEYISCENLLSSSWLPHVETAGMSQEAQNTTLICSCSGEETRVLLAECPFGAGGSPTPRALMQSSDWMYNMTGRNVSDWLVKTVDLFRQKRYGGLSLGKQYHSSISANDVMTILQYAEANSNFSLPSTANSTAAVMSFIESLARSENAQTWIDNNGYHSMPTWLNILNNAALRATVPDGENPREYGIAVVSHPLDFTVASAEEGARSSLISGMFIAVSVMFGMAFIPSGYVLFLIEEKVTKAKHLQFVSGVNQFVYWFSAFIWDYLNYLIPMTAVIIVFLCFQKPEYVSEDNFPCLLCLFLLYGFSVTPLMYLFTFYFEVPSTAYVALTCINLFIGINTSLATFILELVGNDSLKSINEVLVKVFLIFPQYCLGRGLIDLSSNQAYADIYSSFGRSSYVDPFTFSLIGRNLLAMAVEGVGFFALTILIQYRFFIKPKRVSNYEDKKPFNKAEHDEDVVAERERLLNGNSKDILQISNLTKVFKKRGTNKTLVAVDKLCVGVPQGECFGLLGVNGAGKTTTFKMLTGDTSPTAGDASISGLSVIQNLREVQQNTGYCPQFEALFSLLTGREHLIFYAKLRGVPPEDTERVANWAIDKFGLKIYANTPAGTYSGGNKRKLSAAIAFIGYPPIVFLDEPTAGMDPMSRRFLWSRIAEAVRGGRCVVLTSHSMEECEALCSRLAIMVNGKLKCIGSPQHLKNKYGEGYTITLKVGGINPDFEAVEAFVSSSFPNAVLKESHCNMLMYQLPPVDVKLAFVFNLFETNKIKLHIDDYSISQTTLDEVFVGFAKNQTDGIEDEYGIQSSSSNVEKTLIAPLQYENVALVTEANEIPLKEL